MKILITSPSINPMNNVSGIAHLTRLLIKKRVNNYILFEVGKRDDDKRNILWIIKQILTPFRFLYILLRHSNINICHMNYPMEPYSILRESLLVLVAFTLNRKVIVHLRGGRYSLKPINSRILKAFFILTLTMSKAIIALGKNERNYLIKNYNMVSKNVFVLPNAVSVKRNIMDKNYEGLLKILFLGRIDYNKGFREIISALKALRNKMEFIFILCGKGQKDHNSILSECRKLGKYYEYLGVVSGENKIRVLLSSHIFLLPSYFEGLPNSLLEAMAFGNVPIVTSVGSVPEVVEQNINGIFVPIKNSKAIEDAIFELNVNRELLKNMGASAFSKIKTEYSFDKYINKLNDIYNYL